MAFENMNMDDLEPEVEETAEETPPEEQKNRTFMVRWMVLQNL